MGGCSSAGGSGSEIAPPAPAPTQTAATAAAPRPLLCRAPLDARVSGRVGSAAATELSGLALSHSRPRVLWTHNDSGDRARVLAVTPAGRLLADIAVTGAENVDWEDIAIGPGGALYIGDIGDNAARRPHVVVYRTPEPRLAPRGAAPTPTATAPAGRFVLRYPDGPRDAEALLVDPTSGALAIVAKSFGAGAGVYAALRPSPATATTLRRSGAITLAAGDPVTAGDMSADGRTIVLRTYARAYVWLRRGGESIAVTLRRRPCRARVQLLAEGQGEALAVTRGGGAFYTVPEGGRPAIRRYRPAHPVSGP